ncbi:MAG TPA: hypothetical protein VIK06_02390 [Candidatus Limnocylindrales bacterium]
MKTRMSTLIAGVAIAGALAFSSAAVVTAAAPLIPGGPAGSGVCAAQFTALKAPVTVDALHAFGDCEIQRRFTTLATLATRVSGSKVLTSSDAAALTAEIGATKTGLTGLKATIDAETSIPALKADIVKIATDYRVYLLVGLQVNLVSGADRVVASQTVFTKIDTNLAARIAAAKAAGKGTTTAQTDLDAMNKAVTQAVGLATPLPATLLPLTPAQYNAGTAGPVLNSARTALVQARDLLKSAVQDAKACRAALA